MFHLNRISRKNPKKPLEQDQSIGLLCLFCKYILTVSGFQGTLTLLQRVVTQRNLPEAQEKYGQLSICTRPSHSSWTLMVTRLSLHGAVVQSALSCYCNSLLHVQIFAWKACQMLIHRRPGSCLIFLMLLHTLRGRTFPELVSTAPSSSPKLHLKAGTHTVSFCYYLTLFFPPHHLSAIVSHYFFFLL